MTDTQHPITPPPEIAAQWRRGAPTYRDGGVGRELWLIDRAALWGADQELEACCEWLEDTDCDDPQEAARLLRAARRPKPPSLKEAALARLASLEKLAESMGHDPDDTIRRALEQLDD